MGRKKGRMDPDSSDEDDPDWCDKPAFIKARKRKTHINSNNSRNQPAAESKTNKERKANQSNPYKCFICDKKYPLEKALDYHLIRSHMKTPYHHFTCPTCNKPMQDEPSLKSHFKQNLRHILQPPPRSKISTELNEIPVGCAFCDETFFNLDCLNFHIKRHYFAKTTWSGKRYRCCLCPKSRSANFYQISTLEKHLPTHFTKKCPKCLGNFLQMEKLIDHVRICKQLPKVFQCALCDKVFSQIGTLSKHLTITHENCAMACYACGRVFPTDQELKGHHQNNQCLSAFPCEICHKIFSSLPALYNHFEQHPKLMTDGKEEELQIQKQNLLSPKEEVLTVSNFQSVDNQPVSSIIRTVDKSQNEGQEVKSSACSATNSERLKEEEISDRKNKNKKWKRCFVQEESELPASEDKECQLCTTPHEFRNNQELRKHISELHSSERTGSEKHTPEGLTWLRSASSKCAVDIEMDKKESFISAKSKKEKKVTVTTVQTFRCESCYLSFPDDVQLGIHIDLRHSSNLFIPLKKYPCSRCNIVFYDEQSYSYHHEKVHLVNYINNTVENRRTLHDNLKLSISPEETVIIQEQNVLPLPPQLKTKSLLCQIMSRKSKQTD